MRKEVLGNMRFIKIQLNQKLLKSDKSLCYNSLFAAGLGVSRLRVDAQSDARRLVIRRSHVWSPPVPKTFITSRHIRFAILLMISDRNSYLQQRVCTNSEMEKFMSETQVWKGGMQWTREKCFRHKLLQ